MSVSVTWSRARSGFAAVVIGTSSARSNYASAAVSSFSSGCDFCLYLGFWR